MTNNKISFIHFELKYKDYPTDQYLKLLAENGFSKEALIDIGIRDEELSKVKGKIFTQSVLDKYNEFINELNKQNEAPQSEASE